MENFLQYHLKDFIELAITIVIVCVLFKAIDKMDENVKNKITSAEENSPILGFIPLLHKVFKILIVFFILAGILQHHGYSMTSLVAGFGITGLAVGFAAKETIANVLGSFSLLADKVYNLGDYVIINEVEGFVEEINLRSTKIRTLDNALVVIPNNITANAVVTNASAQKKRRMDEYIDLTYDTPSDKIQRALDILSEIAQNDNEFYNDYTIAVSTLGENSIKIRVVAYIKTTEWAKFVKIKGSFIQEVIRRFNEENIEFAFPTRTVYVKHEN